VGRPAKPAVDASLDPMIAFARLVDADARAIRKRYDDEVEAPIGRGGPIELLRAIQGVRDNVYRMRVHVAA